jgi:hypothetical protein
MVLDFEWFREPREGVLQQYNIDDVRAMQGKRFKDLTLVETVAKHDELWRKCKFVKLIDLILPHCSRQKQPDLNTALQPAIAGQFQGDQLNRLKNLCANAVKAKMQVRGIDWTACAKHISCLLDAASVFLLTCNIRKRSQLVILLIFQRPFQPMFTQSTLRLSRFASSMHV